MFRVQGVSVHRLPGNQPQQSACDDRGGCFDVADVERRGYSPIHEYILAVSLSPHRAGGGSGGGEGAGGGSGGGDTKPLVVPASAHLSGRLGAVRAVSSEAAVIKPDPTGLFNTGVDEPAEAAVIKPDPTGLFNTGVDQPAQAAVITGLFDTGVDEPAGGADQPAGA